MARCNEKRERESTWCVPIVYSRSAAAAAAGAHIRVADFSSFFFYIREPLRGERTDEVFRNNSAMFTLPRCAAPAGIVPRIILHAYTHALHTSARTVAVFPGLNVPGNRLLVTQLSIIMAYA